MMSFVQHHRSNDREVPLFWNRITLLMAFGKAAIAGAGLGIAVLGAFDAALAATVASWWESFNYIDTLDIAASIGAVVGVIAKFVID